MRHIFVCSVPTAPFLFAVHTCAVQGCCAIRAEYDVSH
jgi:hypothetical protein